MNLEQLEKDIKSGKSKTVYYSSQSLWWTHLESDVEEATKKGIEVMNQRFAQRLADPLLPKVEKQRLQSLKNMIDENPNSHKVPTDPNGAPLFMMEIEKWIDPAFATPEHFGTFGLDAFMKTHHQNSKGQFFSSYKVVNWQIDKDRGTLSEINHIDNKSVEGSYLTAALALLSLDARFEGKKPNEILLAVGELERQMQLKNNFMLEEAVKSLGGKLK